MSLKGKKAIIVGATGVIGKTIADFFAKEGCLLLLSGNSQEKLNEIKIEFQKKHILVEVFKADVSNKQNVIDLFNFADKYFGSLNVLVNAAGAYGSIGPIEQCEPEEWIKAINVNLIGTMMCIRYSLPLFKKNGQGKIITFAGGGEGPLPNFSSYVSSKGGVLRLTETLAEELKELNIEVNSISPGAVRSGFTDNLLKAGKIKAGEKMYKKTLEQVDNGGVSPEKAAELAVFLASEESNGLTGRNISALWDNWKKIPKHLKCIKESDIYTFRRIKPKDRGYDWQ